MDDKIKLNVHVASDDTFNKCMFRGVVINVKVAVASLRKVKTVQSWHHFSAFIHRRPLIQFSQS